VERTPRVELDAPRTCRDLAHATEQAFFGPRPQQDESVLAERHIGRAAAQNACLLWCLARVAFLLAARTRRAGCAERTEGAGGRFGCAQCRAEIHHGLREIAGAAFGRELLRKRPDARLCARQRLLDREQARDHALDIAIDWARAPIECDRC